MTQTVQKPIPVPDELTAPFFDGARDGKLMLQHCTACDGWSFPVRERCPHCFAPKLEWRAASGKGTLYTFAIMHQVMNPGFAGQTPYNVSQVDLAEGVRMVSNVIGIASDALKIGMTLEVVFDNVGDGVHVPKFRPVTGECA
ncbi:MAG: OB-fold domain-containing protein [Rhodospirillales bacterium]